MYQSALGDAPLQGAGQGIGAGPSLWALIITIIISAMKRVGHGVQLLSPVHHIQTGYRISKSMYQSALGDAPLQGAGQGNGAGPSLWALISTVIISAMKRVGHEVQLLSPISNLSLWIVCFAFVDNAVGRRCSNGSCVLGFMVRLWGIHRHLLRPQVFQWTSGWEMNYIQRQC
jgi:hypothetical protein